MTGVRICSKGLNGGEGRPASKSESERGETGDPKPRAGEGQETRLSRKGRRLTGKHLRGLLRGNGEEEVRRWSRSRKAQR